MMKRVLAAAITASLLLAGCGSPTAPVKESPDLLVGTVGSTFRITTGSRVSSASVSPGRVASVTIHDDYLLVLCLEFGSAAVTYQYPSGTIIAQGIVCNRHAQGAGG
jgi:uncharacterized protein YcfL